MNKPGCHKQPGRLVSAPLIRSKMSVFPHSSDCLRANILRVTPVLFAL